MSKARNTNVSVRAFANAWRRRFSAKSDSTRRALAEMVDAFASRSEKTERGLRTWEDVWGSTSGRCRQATLSPALLRAFEPLLSARPELRTSPCDALNVEPERTFNAFCFLMQTYVAQSIVAVLERYYELSESELSAIFGESPFDWAKSVRKTLRVGDDDLKTLQFEKFARENDPFAETYAKFFSFELRKTLGEFYTPAPLAKYLTRRARTFRRDRPDDPRPNLRRGRLSHNRAAPVPRRGNRAGRRARSARGVRRQRVCRHNGARQLARRGDVARFGRGPQNFAPRDPRRSSGRRAQRARGARLVL